MQIVRVFEGDRQDGNEDETSDVFKVVAHIDSSFSLHPDGKSHSGVMVKVGGILVYFRSRKQKCVSKSPTKAELVALSEFSGTFG
jgi:hypothetical protein